MATVTNGPRSILGDLHQYYAVKTQEGGGILEDPNTGKLEVYPAGYTKPSNRQQGVQRQVVYQMLYEAAVKLRKEKDLYPFGTEGHNIEIVHDPANQLLFAGGEIE